MSNIQLKFGLTDIDINKDSYKLDFLNKQTIRETEAGTLTRDIKRMGVPHISVSMPANDSEYATIYSTYISGSAVQVTYYNPGAGASDTFDGFVENLTANLVSDAQGSGEDSEWNISFEITSM